MIQKYKKKCIAVSLILIVTGMLIAIIGFGTAGFQYSRLEESAKGDVWYQTIHADGNNLWYGIKLDDDVNLFVIGNSD